MDSTKKVIGHVAYTEKDRFLASYDGGIFILGSEQRIRDHAKKTSNKKHFFRKMRCLELLTDLRDGFKYSFDIISYTRIYDLILKDCVEFGAKHPDDLFQDNENKLITIGFGDTPCNSQINEF